MPRAIAEVANRLGLHARPSAKLTQLATQYRCDVWLEREGRRVNAKSIMGVMMLAAAQGTKLTIETEGDDAEAALTAIVELIASRFGERE
ncbi:HPr family phosphocarrier protein [Uliginosibacterium gangwonense]|uniref:HPr family phosphocarrier protein n=1 Tax=Uliginosibacterium gangwonense TaxID=392736 RepID=UPI00037371DC|nr:HPr family phosphocarrier protein [Uliginosibacterium gangwonense]